MKHSTSKLKQTTTKNTPYSHINAKNIFLYYLVEKKTTKHIQYLLYTDILTFIGLLFAFNTYLQPIIVIINAYLLLFIILSAYIHQYNATFLKYINDAPIEANKILSNYLLYQFQKPLSQQKKNMKRSYLYVWWLQHIILETYRYQPKLFQPYKI